MRRRHPHPRLWLMTDPRIGTLDLAIAALPRRSGIVFRHHHLPLRERRALFARIAVLARRQGHLVLLADTPLRAWQWRADGAHDTSRRRSMGLRSMAVHDRAELTTARRGAADLIFVSPFFETRTHPGQRGIGAVRAGLIAGAMRQRAIALGGMTASRAIRLHGLGFYGWAAIDAFRT